MSSAAAKLLCTAALLCTQSTKPLSGGEVMRRLSVCDCGTTDSMSLANASEAITLEASSEAVVLTCSMMSVARTLSVELFGDVNADWVVAAIDKQEIDGRLVTTNWKVPVASLTTVALAGLTGALTSVCICTFCCRTVVVTLQPVAALPYSAILAVSARSVRVSETKGSLMETVSRRAMPLQA